VAGFVAIGLLAWALMWAAIRPRAEYDTLWYSMYAYQYGGASEAQSWDESWDLVHEYGDPALLALLHRDSSGAWWSGWDDPRRARWIGIYRMRPVTPLVGAAAYPIMGMEAPLLASVLAVMLVTLTTGLVLAPLVGWLAAGAFLVLSFGNALFSRWLITLTSDGLGIALWFLVLATSARYVHDGQRRWLLTAGVATLVLAFTRQSNVVVAIGLLLCLISAAIARVRVRRRFAAAALVTTVPIIAFAVYTAAAGLPSFADQLQDIPTLHFAKPDVADPIGFLVGRDLSVARSIARSLLGQPVVVLTATAGFAGLALTRRWWAAPFLAALLSVPLLLAAHPVLTEAARTLAPAWVSIHLGLALVVTRLLAGAGSRLRLRNGRGV
jgi:hypothetical protein